MKINVENMLWFSMILCLAFVGFGLALILSAGKEINPVVANDEAIVGLIFFGGGTLGIFIWAFVREWFKTKNPNIAKQFKLKQTSKMPLS